MWPKTDFNPVLSPNGRRKQGRPKKKRILGAEEYINPKYPHKLRKIGQNYVFKSKCGQHGHNRRTCTTPMAEESDTSRVDTFDVGASRRGVQMRGGRNDVRGGRTGVQTWGGGRTGVKARGGGWTGVQVGGGGKGGASRGQGRGASRGKARGGGTQERMVAAGQGRGASRGKARGGGGHEGMVVAGQGRGAAGQGKGVTIRGGGVFRGGATLRSNQLNILTNYDQATQVSQTSTVTAVRKDKRMATIATLYGNKP